jgi:hypothetical protein
VSDYDQSPILDVSPTPLTRDFIGLCIGILTVVLVILIVAICKWSRCQCSKHSNDVDDHNQVFSSILQQNTSTPHAHSRHQQQRQRQQQHQQRSSSCDQRPGSVYQPVSHHRDELISPVQATSNNYRLTDIKVPRVTITTLPVQPSQQLVPRLSISPQVSSSSITRSTYSIKP